MDLGNRYTGCSISGSFTTVNTSGVPTSISGSKEAAGDKSVGNAYVFVIKANTDGAWTCSTAGVTESFDCLGSTGFNGFTINTASSQTFYSCGHDYIVRMHGGLVDSNCIAGYTLGTFSLRNRSELNPTALYALEDAFDDTGGVKMSLKQLAITATSNDAAIVATGSGSGHGIIATGGATGDGMRLLGGATSGDGLHCAAQTDGEGMDLVGASNGHGMLATGAGTGEGAHFTAGGGANGHGAHFEGVGANSHGALFSRGGAGGDDMKFANNDVTVATVTTLTNVINPCSVAFRVETLSDSSVSGILDAAITEPGGVFAWAGATLRNIVGWLGAVSSNQIVQEATLQGICDRAVSTTIAKANVSDDGTQATRGSFS